MEKELKFSLATRQDHQRLLASLADPRPCLQKNYYFDSTDRCLSAAGRSALRIRGEGPGLESLEWEVTLKLGVSREGAYFQAHEWNAPLPTGVAPRILAGGDWPEEAWALLPLQQFEANFSRRALVCLGQLENIRVRCPLFEDEVAEVDETHFPDGSIDYEIEVETERPEEVEAFLHERARDLGLTLSPQAKTKFRRFLERSQGI